MLKPKRKILRKEIQRDPFLESLFSFKTHFLDYKQLYTRITIGFIFLVIVGTFIIRSKASNYNSAELLLSKGYAVHGIVRRVALEDETHRLWRIRNIVKDLHLHAASLESYPSLYNILQKIKPDEVYHLAAQSYVGYSFEDEFSTFNSNINGTHHMLSAVKEFSTKTRFYFAGSSEMFGKVKNFPQDENSMMSHY